MEAEAGVKIESDEAKWKRKRKRRRRGEQDSSTQYISYVIVELKNVAY